MTVARFAEVSCQLCHLIYLWKAVNVRVCAGGVALLTGLQATLQYFCLGIFSAMAPFFVTYVLVGPSGGDPDQLTEAVGIMGFGIIATFCASFISTPGWLWLANKVGKYKACFGGAGLDVRRGRNRWVLLWSMCGLTDKPATHSLP